MYKANKKYTDHPKHRDTRALPVEDSANACELPGFVTNYVIRRGLAIPDVKTEMRKITSKYVEKLDDHVNPEAATLVEK